MTEYEFSLEKIQELQLQTLETSQLMIQAPDPARPILVKNKNYRATTEP